jgi:hypothetical protein
MWPLIHKRAEDRITGPWGITVVIPVGSPPEMNLRGNKNFFLKSGNSP